MIFSQGCLLYIIVQLCIVRSFIIIIGFVISFCFFWQMSMESSTYIGFADGASCHTQHSASAAWVIYTPMGQVEPRNGLYLKKYYA